jgi:hypothetical protein
MRDAKNDDGYRQCFVGVRPLSRSDSNEADASDDDSEFDDDDYYRWGA